MQLIIAVAVVVVVVVVATTLGLTRILTISPRGVRCLALQDDRRGKRCASFHVVGAACLSDSSAIISPLFAVASKCLGL